MRHAAWILAYHGCEKKVGESILGGKQEVRASSNLYDWLGSGSYFWENSYSRALHWAKFLKKNPSVSKTRIKSPFVIGAIINPGNCLDLTEDSSLKILEAAYTRFEDLFRTIKEPMPRNEPGYPGDPDLVKRKLDCAVVNFLHGLREVEELTPFDTVRGPFMEGLPLFPGSGFSGKTHLQWCVRDPKKSLLAYFRPRKQMGSDF